MKMTNEAIRVAIAELCGWNNYPNGDNPHCSVRFNHRWFNSNDGCCYNECPNCPEDLNAMHEAEKTVENKREYVYQLVAEMKEGEYTVMAPALQRAIAFLKVKGKWVE